MNLGWLEPSLVWFKDFQEKMRGEGVDRVLVFGDNKERFYTNEYSPAKAEIEESSGVQMTLG